MNDFTASNGITVANHGGNWDQTTIHFSGEVLGLTKERTNSRDVVFEDRDLEGLREFFQAEADERLGRWRDPEDPVFVVYSGVAWNGMYAPIRVVAETNGASWLLDREDHEPNVHESVLAVARRYFAAHPEPKPWHDAKPGEVWELAFSHEGGGGIEPFTVDRAGKFRHPNYVGGVSLVDSEITAGRRIWPEAVAS